MVVAVQHPGHSVVPSGSECHKMPFDLFDNPFGDTPQAQQYVDPRRDESTLGNIMEGSLGGLSYIGKILDKTFGGRAVRGILDGNFGEALSVLPMSDTLGITDYKNVVEPRKLLDKWGLTTPGDDSWQHTAAEIATGVALDPGTWVGAAVPKLVSRGLLAGGRAAGAASAAVTGGRVNPYSFSAGLLDKAKRPARALFDDAVGGAWSPIGQSVASDTFTPTVRAGNYGANVSAAADNIKLSPYVLADNADPLAIRTAMTQAAEGFHQDAAISLQKLGYGPTETADLLGLGTDLGARARATQPAEAAQGLASKNLLDLADWQMAANAEVQGQNQFVQRANAAAAAQGLPAPPLMGIQPLPHEGAAQYVPRTRNQFDNAEGAFARRQGTGMGGASEFQMDREQILKGFPGGTAQVNELSKDPDLLGAARLLDQTGATQKVLSGLLDLPIGKIGQVPLNHPAYKQAASVADYLHSLPPEIGHPLIAKTQLGNVYGTNGQGLFNMDLVGNVKHREIDAVRNIASAKTTMDAIGRPGFVRPAADLAAEGQQFVRLPEFMDAMRLAGTDANGIKIAHAKAAQMLGIPVADMEKLKDFAIPMDIATDLGRIGKAWSTPSSLQPVVQAWDNTVNWFKRNLTVPFPAFHTRNLMSGIFNMWRDGGGAGAVSNDAGNAMLGMIRGKTLTPEVAAKLYPGMSIGQASNEALKELIGGQIAFTRSGQAADRLNPGVGRGVMAEDVPQLASQARPISEDIGGFLGTFKPEAGKRAYNPFNTETFAPTIAGEKLGNAVEDWIRGSHYLAKRLQGSAPEDALASVLKYQIDYGKSTEFEKNVMKRIMPWYSYSRGNLPPILEDLADNPAKLLGVVRGVTGSRENGEFVPPWIAEGAATPLPGAPEGSKRFVSSFGLPVEDELVKMVGSALHGDGSRVAQQAFGMSIPFAKIPAEVATGTQMYSGRKLEELRPYEFATLGGLVPEDTARKASQVIANTPASRLVGSIDKFIDTRKDAGATALNTLTGTRITDVDLERTKAAAAMQLLKEQLLGHPGIKSHQDIYAPKDQRGNVAPNDLMMLDLLKEIEQRATQRAQRAKMGLGQ